MPFSEKTVMSPDDRKDRIYAEPRESVADFRFDRRVAHVFPDMIQRSVPGYATMIKMISVLAAEYVQPNSLCYDLGCSLGASSLALQRGIRSPGCRIIAVDNSPDMLERARQQLPPGTSTCPIELVCADILDLEILDASMVVLNFTLQFIVPERRLALLQSIHQALRPQGILVISEKIRFTDREQELQQSRMHHAFKRANGYDDLEISQKRSALENVLIPETIDQHRQRLSAAGFQRSDLWFQCFNFVSLIAHR